MQGVVGIAAVGEGYETQELDDKVIADSCHDFVCQLLDPFYACSGRGAGD